MAYNVIQPPFTLQFREMSKPDLKAYFDWFLNQIPVRLPILESSIQETPGFESWTADFTVESLSLLGEWYASQVGTRPRSQDELNEIKKKLSFPIPVSEQELTNKTFSLAIDVGMYLSEVFMRNFPNLRWDLILKNKKFAHYGQPVLVGFRGNVPFNPVWMMLVLAYSIVDGTRDGRGLKELYEIWAKMVCSKV